MPSIKQRNSLVSVIKVCRCGASKVIRTIRNKEISVVDISFIVLFLV